MYQRITVFAGGAVLLLFLAAYWAVSKKPVVVPPVITQPVVQEVKNKRIKLLTLSGPGDFEVATTKTGEMKYRIEISSLHVPAAFNTMSFDIDFEHVDKEGERDGWVPHRWRYQNQKRKDGPTG